MPVRLPAALPLLVVLALPAGARPRPLACPDGLTPDERITIRRRVFAPDSDARALVAEVEVTNPTAETLDYGLVEFWDPNLLQVALELLTSDLLQGGTSDGIERRRRALSTQFTQQASWDAGRRVALLETTATAPPVASRFDPSLVPWFPEPLFLAVLDDGVAITGNLTTAASEPLALEVLLPSGLRGAALAVTAGGAPAFYTFDGDVVRFLLPPAPGLPVAWRIAAAS